MDQNTEWPISLVHVLSIGFENEEFDAIDGNLILYQQSALESEWWKHVKVTYTYSSLQ